MVLILLSFGLAVSLEKKLQTSKQRNDSLQKQTRDARQLADQAIIAAEDARSSAESIKQELAEKTAVLRADSEAMKEAFEKSQSDVELKFQSAMKEQEAGAEYREKFIVGLSLLLFVIAFGVILLTQRKGVMQAADPVAEAAIGADASSNEEVFQVKNNTVLHTDELKKFVLEGRDEDGIRYLSRISGDKLLGDGGVVIGRNPKDSPHVINHADVSRKHARMKVLKNRVFIEDLGSTNGTSVNGQSIEEKGPVSVDSGDQIMIGSVVMNLRVLLA
jgi:hypothetical protein